MSANGNMDIFGRTFACECGKTHSVKPREVLYARGAVEKLPEICARAASGRRAAALMDERTRRVAGRDACRALAQDSWLVSELSVPDPPGGGSPVCDDVTKEKLAAQVGAVDLVVPVGSGVLTDLGRWLATERGLPFVSFATAASMNGYASSIVAPTLKGVKTVVWAAPPIAVAADPAVIERAPWELTASGLGDILAKPVSSADWRMNGLLFGDYYCRRAVNLIADIEPLYMNDPEGLRAGSPKAIGALFQGLILTGVAMNMAETSAPCSGAEHMVSHALDMMSSLDGVAHDLHGRQVGIGTLLTSEIYRRVLAVESPQFVAPRASVDREFWGRLADGVAEQYEGKIQRLRLAAENLAKGEAWDRMREALAPMLISPEAIRECLARAGAAFRAGDIRCSEERLLTALLHAHEIRSRFSILDLARLIGIMPRAAAEIVETWS